MTPDRPNLDRPDAAAPPRRSRIRQRGQGLVMFVAAIVFLIGLLAIVVDVTWYWANSLQVQRAADAAALAGAVWLPDQPTKAHDVAIASATQNGYTTGGGVTVTAVQNATRDIQLDTSVSAPVSTFFMRLFGINSIQATRKSAAEYVVPVPMGSPLNYFGAFGDAARSDPHRLPDSGSRPRQGSSHDMDQREQCAVDSDRTVVYATTARLSAQRSALQHPVVRILPAVPGPWWHRSDGDRSCQQRRRVQDPGRRLAGRRGDLVRGHRAPRTANGESARAGPRRPSASTDERTSPSAASSPPAPPTPVTGSVGRTGLAASSRTPTSASGSRRSAARAPTPSTPSRSR